MRVWTPGQCCWPRHIPIAPDDTAARLHDRLAALGATLIVQALDRLAAGDLVPSAPARGRGDLCEQDPEERIAHRLAGAGGRIADRIRAFDPFPGATARLVGRAETLKIWSARADADARTDCDARVDRTAASACPGEVVFADERTLAVLCGGGTRLRLVELQKPGGRRMPVAEFLRGYPVPVGARFELSAPGG
jgi:methionyl-tRNA formyltransferase